MPCKKFSKRVQRSREGDLWNISRDIVVNGTQYYVVKLRLGGEMYMRPSDYIRTDYYRTYIPVSYTV